MIKNITYRILWIILLIKGIDVFSMLTARGNRCKEATYPMGSLSEHLWLLQLWLEIKQYQVEICRTLAIYENAAFLKGVSKVSSPEGEIFTQIYSDLITYDLTTWSWRMRPCRLEAGRVAIAPSCHLHTNFSSLWATISYLNHEFQLSNFCILKRFHYPIYILTEKSRLLCLIFVKRHQFDRSFSEITAQNSD